MHLLVVNWIEVIDWVSEWLDGWMDGWMEGWISVWVSARENDWDSDWVSEKVSDGRIGLVGIWVNYIFTSPRACPLSYIAEEQYTVEMMHETSHRRAYCWLYPTNTLPTHDDP